MSYDLVVVGSGFASVFFVARALEIGAVRSVAIVERGDFNDWEWQITNGRTASEDFAPERYSINTGPIGKRWPHTIGVGGGSNCWWANAMRFHPHDFDLQGRYGVGRDWPIGYDDLEPYYCDAEDMMAISGDPDSAAMFPRSRPFPQPPHRFSSAGRLLKAAHPDSFFSMPQARARVATDHRGPCCSNNICGLCPANAKFMLINDMRATLQDPRVTLLTRPGRSRLRDPRRHRGIRRRPWVAVRPGRA
jgi:choline dehydrogenase-like flavoprotein